MNDVARIGSFIGNKDGRWTNDERRNKWNIILPDIRAQRFTNAVPPLALHPSLRRVSQRAIKSATMQPQMFAAMSP